MKRSNLYKEALAHWGRTGQMDMLVEECAELIQALQKFNHRHGGKENVIEELADVEIMCEQMRFIFDPIDINRIKDQKLERLERLLCL